MDHRCTIFRMPCSKLVLWWILLRTNFAWCETDSNPDFALNLQCCEPFACATADTFCGPCFALAEHCSVAGLAWALSTRAGVQDIRVRAFTHRLCSNHWRTPPWKEVSAYAACGSGTLGHGPALDWVPFSPVHNQVPDAARDPSASAEKVGRNKIVEPVGGSPLRGGSPPLKLAVSFKCRAWPVALQHLAYLLHSSGKCGDRQPAGHPMARHPRNSHGLLSALYPCSMLRYQAATARPALCECLATSTGEVCLLSTQPGSDRHIPRSQRHGLGPLIRSSVFVTCLSCFAVPPILRSPRVEAAVVGWPWLIKNHPCTSCLHAFAVLCAASLTLALGCLRCMQCAVVPVVFLRSVQPHSALRSPWL